MRIIHQKNYFISMKRYLLLVELYIRQMSYTPETTTKVMVSRKFHLYKHQQLEETTQKR